MACTGVGSTMTFSSGITFTSRIKSIAGLRRTVEALDDTALNSTDYKEFCPDDLAEIETVTVEFYYEGKLPDAGDLGSVNLSIVDGSVFSGTAFVEEVSSPDLEVGVRMMGQLVLRFDGKTFVYTQLA